MALSMPKEVQLKDTGYTDKLNPQNTTHVIFAGILKDLIDKFAKSRMKGRNKVLSFLRKYIKTT
jgi:hypothetical protein